MNTMKGAFFVGNRNIELRDVPVPNLGDGEVLLRVVGCGVCGTDHHIYEGELTDGISPPVVLGHEIAARVEAVGSNVRDVREGQFCAVDPLIGCGTCPMCRSGKVNLCGSPTIVGYMLNGGFAQYVAVPVDRVVPLDESVGAEGGVLCETLACVIHGYDRLGLPAGASAMILGAGTVGLLWLEVLKSAPCRKIVQTEIVEFRRRKAKHLGADVVIDPNSEDLQRRVYAELPGGADVIIDATGSPDAVEQAIPLLGRGGTFLIFGVCPEGASIRLDPFALYNKEVRIIASKMPPGTLDRAARLIEAGMISCNEIVTETRPLDRIAKSIEGFTTHRNTQVKVAIDPWG